MNYIYSKRPFVGLRSFESDENDIFFGRDKLIGKMLDKLSTHRFLAVTGISGGGKSSLVKTGLVNGLRSNLIFEAGALWTVIDMRPNNRPIYILAEALLDKIPNEKRFENDIEFLTSRFKRNPKSFIDFLHENRRFFEGSLLIIIDQFEEIFRYEDNNSYDSVSDTEYNNIMVLVDLLIHSSNQRDLKVYNIITIRADYLGKCALFHGLPELINKSQFIIPRLTRMELHDAIAMPVRMHGGEIEPVLVNRILNDLGHNLDQLPQMQHALMRMWSSAKEINKEKPKLTLELYQKNGGLGKSISDHADEIYKILNDNEKILCEKIFKFITRINSHGQEIRIQQFIKDISYAVDAEVEEIESLTQKFRKENVSFLRPNQRYVLKENIMLDITHESIMRQWKRLKSWMKEEARSKDNFRELKIASEHYHDGVGALLIEPDLSRMLDWKRDSNLTKRWANRYGDEFEAVMGFLNKSYSAKEERLKKEELEKERQKMEKLRREKRKRRNIVILVSLIVLFLSYFGYSKYELTEQELIIARESKAKELAEQNIKLVEQKLKIEQENRNRELAEKKLEIEKENTARESAEKKLAIKDRKIARINLLKNKLENKKITQREYNELINLNKTNDIEMARLLIIGFNQKLNGEKSLKKAKKILDKHRKSYSAKELLREYNYYSDIIPLKDYKEAKKLQKRNINLY
jgi:hypothetical protein